MASRNVLDKNVESSLIQGSATEKPIQYYIETAYDILYYYQVFIMHVELNCNKILLNASDTIDGFEKSLNVTDQFKQFYETFLFNCSFIINSD